MGRRRKRGGERVKQDDMQNMQRKKEKKSRTKGGEKTREISKGSVGRCGGETGVGEEKE